MYREGEVLAGSPECYQLAIKSGIAKEQARFLLPLSTQTTIYMTGNIRSWITYCDVRTKPGVQLEHKEIAQAALETLLVEVPELTDYFNDRRDL